MADILSSQFICHGLIFSKESGRIFRTALPRILEQI